MTTATLILTKEEIEQFKQFQKHIEMINMIIVSGIFDIGYGKGIITFCDNKIVNIVKEESVYYKLSK
jgi:hypothetical protein